MSEEEKEAIEFLKFSLLDYEELDTGVLEYIDEKRKTLLNYIDKLQKENEKLNEKNMLIENTKIGYKIALEQLKADKNKLINYIAVRENKTYEEVCKEFDI